MKKSVLLICLAMVLVFFICGCSQESSGGGSKKSKIVGEWEISGLMVEPQYKFQTARNATINQIAEAFPEVDTIVEFTTEKYDNGQKMISESSLTAYSLMKDNKISVGDAVGTYELDGDVLVIEFKDIATITLEKVD